VCTNGYEAIFCRLLIVSCLLKMMTSESEELMESGDYMLLAGAHRARRGALKNVSGRRRRRKWQ